MAEQLVRKFNPEQLQGLKEIGWFFYMEVKPLSLEQLCNIEENKPFVGFVTPLKQMREKVPTARDIAVDVHYLFVPDSEYMPSDILDSRIERYVSRLKNRNLKTGTLQGIDFGKDYASVYVQLDIMLQKTYPLDRYVDLIRILGFTRTIDEKDFDEQGNSYLTRVGRVPGFPSEKLSIYGWDTKRVNPSIGVIIVATPEGDR